MRVEAPEDVTVVTATATVILSPCKGRSSCRRLLDMFLFYTFSRLQELLNPLGDLSAPWISSIRKTVCWLAGTPCWRPRLTSQRPENVPNHVYRGRWREACGIHTYWSLWIGNVFTVFGRWQTHSNFFHEQERVFELDNLYKLWKLARTLNLDSPTAIVSRTFMPSQPEGGVAQKYWVSY